MRDILISSAVCVACLLVAFVSQLVAPSTVEASAPPAVAASAAPAADSASMGLSPAVVAPPLELDPEDANPALFTMAPGSGTFPAVASAGDGGESGVVQAGAGGGEGENAEVAQAGAAALGGEIVAPRERMTSSGLLITDLVEGEGAEATAGQTVVVNYRGTLENGREFDSSYGRGPFRFPLGAGRVIQGWDEGVAGMKVGGKRKLVIPPELGYGARGAGGVIPPNATLIFEVELVDVEG
jgi:peptidylprolyl isomerase